ncbi:hypothetical protein HanIR_Chr17g0884651 [Helianthus annuus]|nr:hypothetical protein HanIR_Chr17g0884651 [Helianthus annuus]
MRSPRHEPARNWSPPRHARGHRDIGTTRDRRRGMRKDKGRLSRGARGTSPENYFYFVGLMLRTCLILYLSYQN